MNFAARIDRGDLTPFTVKGRYFTTESLPLGEVRLCWSDKTEDTSKWDPLDFWIVPTAMLEDAKAKVRAGFDY